MQKLIHFILLFSLFISCNPYGDGSDVELPNTEGTDNNSGGSSSGGGDYSSFGDGTDGDVTLTSSFFPTQAIPSQTKIWGQTARINSISGNNITLAGAAPSDDKFAVGDEIMWHISTANAACSTDSSLYLGQYGFADITAKAGTTLTLDASITANPNNGNISNASSFGPGHGSYCNIQIVRVANFNNLTVSNNVFLKSDAFSAPSGLGGLVAFRVKDTLTITGANTFTVADRDTQDGSAVGAGLFAHNGSGEENIQGPAADGMGIAACNTSGCGTEANNGAGGGRGLYIAAGPTHFGGGGGGANLGAGGRGGSNTGGTDYGQGGAALTCGGSDCLFMGSASGSGSNASSNNGTYGGGVFLVFAKNISGNLTISANGLSTTNTANSTGGGGAGGSVVLHVQNVASGTVQISANGGNSGNSTVNFGGGGGGGGLASGKICTGSMTATATGGTGGTNTAAGDASTSGGAGVATVDQAATHDFCVP